MNERIYEKLCFRLSRFDGLKVLDLGCGEGLNSVEFARLGAEVTAIDRQAALTECTQELARKKKVKVLTKVSTIQDFQSDVQYDVVLFTFVLHFLPGREQAWIIQRVIDLVKPGGILVFADLEDDLPVSLDCLEELKGSLENVELERFITKDEPHQGANYPHQHRVLYLIGTRKV